MVRPRLRKGLSCGRRGDQSDWRIGVDESGDGILNGLEGEKGAKLKGDWRGFL